MKKAVLAAIGLLAAPLALAQEPVKVGLRRAAFAPSRSTNTTFS